MERIITKQYLSNSLKIILILLGIIAVTIICYFCIIGRIKKHPETKELKRNHIKIYYTPSQAGVIHEYHNRDEYIAHKCKYYIEIYDEKQIKDMINYLDKLKNYQKYIGTGNLLFQIDINFLELNLEERWWIGWQGYECISSSSVVHQGIIPKKRVNELIKKVKDCMYYIPPRDPNEEEWTIKMFIDKNGKLQFTPPLKRGSKK